MKNINDIMKAYNAYCINEFDHEAGPVPADGRLGVAHSSVDNADSYEYWIQVDYDINAQRLEYFQNDALIYSEPFTHEAFISEMPDAAFDYFYSEAVAHSFLEVMTASRTPYGQINIELYETLDDITDVNYTYSVTADTAADALQELADASGYSLEVLTMEYRNIA